MEKPRAKMISEMLRIIFALLTAATLAHAGFPQYFNIPDALNQRPYGYWRGPHLFNSTLYALSRPVVGVSPQVGAQNEDLYHSFIRINPTYNMDNPWANFPLAGGFGPQNRVPKKIVLPWPYCTSDPWIVVKQNDNYNALAKTVNSNQFPTFGWDPTPDPNYYFTTPGCETGRLIYGEDPILFGSRMFTPGVACNYNLGPVCRDVNEKAGVPPPVPACSEFGCSSDTTTLNGDAFRSLLSVTEAASASVSFRTVGDVDPYDLNVISLFRGTITYEVPSTCPLGGTIFFAIPGTSRLDIAAPVTYVQEVTPGNERSATFLSPVPNCGGSRASGVSTYNPTIRMVPVCQQRFPMIPPARTDLNTSTLATQVEWRLLNQISSAVLRGPEDVLGYNTIIWMLSADNLPMPLKTRVRVSLIGSLEFNVSDIIYPDIFLDYENVFYVPVPGDGFPYTLRLSYFANSALPIVSEYRAKDLPSLQTCICSTTPTGLTVGSNVICDATTYNLKRNTTRESLQLPSTAGTSNSVICAIVFGSRDTTLANLTTGVPFWIAAAGSGSSYPPVSYTWSLSDVGPQSGQLFGTTGYNVTGVVYIRGAIKINLVIFDNFRYIKRCSISATVQSAAPVPVLSPIKATIQVNTFLVLDGSNSYSPAGEVLSWSWSVIWPVGGPGSIIGAPEPSNAKFMATAPGTYIVSMKVTAASGDDNQNAYITVVPIPPSPSPGAAPSSAPSTNDGCFNNLPPSNIAYPPNFDTTLPPSLTAPPPPEDPWAAVPSAPASNLIGNILGPALPTEVLYTILIIVLVLGAAVVITSAVKPCLNTQPRGVLRRAR